jgi:hypothetical protein
MIGDSQWIGGGAENGHYVKLNDFFDQEGIKMEDFMPATVTGYAEWPKNTPNYYALPALPTLSAGPTAGTGLNVRNCRPSSRKNTAVILPFLRRWTNSRTLLSSSRAAKSTARQSMALPFTPSAVRKASPWA